MTQNVEVGGVVGEVLAASEARVNITWRGENADMVQAVNRDATDDDVRRWITEAVRTGSVPGLAADPAASFDDFVIDRYGPNEGRPWALIAVRPKTPFGVSPFVVRVRRTEEGP